MIGTGHLHPLAGGLKSIEMCINEMLSPLIGETIDDIPYLRSKCGSLLYSRENGNNSHGDVGN